MIVRDARDEDAEAGALLLRESIRRLCAADHNNDPAAIAAWVANKTAAEFRRWLETPRRSLMVAKRDARLAGVGLIGDDGELQLLYVDPAQQGAGVGKALLAALERRAWERGAEAISLRSTLSALGFYRRFDYAPAREGELMLEKRLPSARAPS